MTSPTETPSPTPTTGTGTGTETGVGHAVAGLAAVAARARELLPDRAVISERSRLRTYECDGLAHYRVQPGLVVIPENAEQLAGVVRACAEHAVPFVARGSGTGLSGGALPHADGVLLGAVGVTGDTSDNDEAAAVAGIEGAGLTAQAE